MTGETCIFCQQDNPRLNRILCENGRFFARYDNFPVSPGHVEIVPKRHVESLSDLSPHEISSAFELVAAAREALDAEHRPDGYNIGINDGTAAGQTIRHLHIHLIPRYDGDLPDPRGGVRNILPGDSPDRWVPSE